MIEEELATKIGQDKLLAEQAKSFFNRLCEYKYSYYFSFMDRPIIQFPQDMVAMQELIWRVKPDLIIETGIAHGGSLVMNAAMLTMLDVCEAIETGKVIDPAVSKRKVLGVDIDIRSHNRIAIEEHPMSSRIATIEGSSIDQAIIEQVSEFAGAYDQILVSLDSNHTHDHVLAELEAYAPLTSVGSYCVVFDTVVEDMPASMFPDRPWGPADNPKTAVWDYLKRHEEFQIDKSICGKLVLTVAPDGYLKRVR